MSREAELSKLTAIVRDARLQETDPDRLVQAIRRLGEMKAVEAVDDLARLLTFRNWYPWEKDPHEPKIEVRLLGTGDRYPAIRALQLIGPPALPTLVKVIEAHKPDSLETQNVMEVIILLSRYERSRYVRTLKDAAAMAPSREAAERLLKAAETLKESKR